MRVSIRYAHSGRSLYSESRAPSRLVLCVAGARASKKNPIRKFVNYLCDLSRGNGDIQVSLSILRRFPVSFDGVVCVVRRRVFAARKFRTYARPYIRISRISVLHFSVLPVGSTLAS